MPKSIISSRKYRKLRRLATRLLANPDAIGAEVEPLLAQAALGLLPVSLPQRSEHAADLAHQAACDGAAANGRLAEFDSPDW